MAQQKRLLLSTLSSHSPKMSTLATFLSGVIIGIINFIIADAALDSCWCYSSSYQSHSTRFFQFHSNYRNTHCWCHYAIQKLLLPASAACLGVSKHILHFKSQLTVSLKCNVVLWVTPLLSRSPPLSGSPFPSNFSPSYYDCLLFHS